MLETIELPTLSSKSYRCPQRFGREEDQDDQAVAKEGNEPQDEEDNAEEVSDHRMLRRKLAPEWVNNVLELRGEVIKLTCT